MNFSDISLSIEELKEQKKHCPQLFVMSNGCNLMSDTLQFEPEWIKANSQSELKKALTHLSHEYAHLQTGSFLDYFEHKFHELERKIDEVNSLIYAWTNEASFINEWKMLKKDEQDLIIYFSMKAIYFVQSSVGKLNPNISIEAEMHNLSMDTLSNIIEKEQLVPQVDIRNLNKMQSFKLQKFCEKEGFTYFHNMPKRSCELIVLSFLKKHVGLDSNQNELFTVPLDKYSDILNYLEQTGSYNQQNIPDYVTHYQQHFYHKINNIYQNIQAMGASKEDVLNMPKFTLYGEEMPEKEEKAGKNLKM